MLDISNKDARRLWLHTHLLSAAPTGPLDVMELIRGLGFVQLDTIQILSRAHHHILWSRNQNYREEMFDPLLAEDRAVFEHFTHDASILPMETLPYWRRQFTRKRDEIDRRKWFTDQPGPSSCAAIKERIKIEGALSTHAFESVKKSSKEVWSRPPHKQALDYMWYAGDLATCYRKNFTKFYNLPERVFPPDLAALQIPDDAQIDWLCRAALTRLGFANAADISRFYDAVSVPEARAWIASQSDLVEVSVIGVDGTARAGVALSDIEDRLATAPSPTTRLRVLNPFDPAIRDRDRLKRLFGMDYKIEIFVPAAKRRYGYYVYPILEGDKFVGRIEARADRTQATLKLVQVWPENGVQWTAKRSDRLNAELDRLGRFIGCNYTV